jgi:hypothetical protein
MEFPHDKQWTLFSDFVKIKDHSTKTQLTYFFDEINNFEVMQKHFSSHGK